MKHYRNKLLCVLGISLAIYSAVSIGITMSIAPMRQWHWEELEFVLPGALVLLSVTLWMCHLARHPSRREEISAWTFFWRGTGLLILVTVLYIHIRAGALFEDPGEFGGPVLYMIIIFSLISQLPGFAAGFIPSFLFVHRLVRCLENSQDGKDEQISGH